MKGQAEREGAWGGGRCRRESMIGPDSRTSGRSGEGVVRATRRRRSEVCASPVLAAGIAAARRVRLQRWCVGTCGRTASWLVTTERPVEGQRDPQADGRAMTTATSRASRKIITWETGLRIPVLFLFIAALMYSLGGVGTRRGSHSAPAGHRERIQRRETSRPRPLPPCPKHTKPMCAAARPWRCRRGCSRR